MLQKWDILDQVGIKDKQEGHPFYQVERLVYQNSKMPTVLDQVLNHQLVPLCP
jgi:hypothetical protein